MEISRIVPFAVILITLHAFASSAPANSADVKFSMLDTDLKEDGKPIRLQLVLAKPLGPGPFPLFVVNHGSTGRGADARRARNRKTEWYQELSDFFTQRGWMVAFPQRRGRGKSDGLYAEGLASGRKGYACRDIMRSLNGFDRALTDIHAAVTALLRRTDVDRERVLIGGVSRGGILSIAYAGKHPARVIGVINFVGGWLIERCRNSEYVHKLLFEKGGEFSKPTLWLYGKKDAYYSIRHMRSNFEAFRKVGGNGKFFALDVPGGHPLGGHRLHPWTDVWSGPVEAYLKRIGAPSKSAVATIRTETSSRPRTSIREKRQEIVRRPVGRGAYVAECDAPIPHDAKIIQPTASVPRVQARFSGLWGPSKWDGKLCHILIVERMTADGKAQIIYSHGAFKSWRINRPAYTRATAEIVDDKLIHTIDRGSRGNVVITYWFSGDTLRGTYQSGAGTSRIKFEPR